MRWVFSHAKLMISWLQWLEKRWGAQRWAIAICQLTELNIKANPPCFSMHVWFLFPCCDSYSSSWWGLSSLCWGFSFRQKVKVDICSLWQASHLSGLILSSDSHVSSTYWRLENWWRCLGQFQQLCSNLVGQQLRRHLFKSAFVITNYDKGFYGSGMCKLHRLSRPAM